MEIADKHYKTHKQDVNNVKDAQDYFRENNSRYDDCRDFLYRSTVTKHDRDILQENQKPVVECNVLEPFVSKFCSEWAEQTPDVKVRLANNHLLSKVNFKQADIVECHIRNIFNGSVYTTVAQEIMEDLMSGGFGVVYVYTEYENYRSHRQAIRFRRIEDPKLCFFDPLAKEKHKGDGRYCGELIPKLKSELEEEFKGINLSEIESSSSGLSQDFRWGWKNEHYEDMVYVCNYFYKEYTYETFYEISDPLNPDLTHGIFKSDWDKWMAEWPKTMPRGIARPSILKQERRKICKIMRKQFVDNVILTKPEETEFESFPYIFFDGNSKLIRGDQITRPYIYNVIDLQRIKNITLSTLVNELETMRQSDISIAQEALPSENQQFMQTWLNPQKAQAAFVHKAFTKDGKQLPPPTPFPRGGLNQELIQFAEQLDMGVQRGLGSYDQQNGMQNGELSGIAIVKGSINSNYSAMPYVNNYVICLNQLIKVIVELLPKFYKTMTTLPVTSSDGKHDYVVINNSQDPNSPSLDYESTDLEVVVTAGANFDIQRMEALKAILGLMKESGAFRAMMEPKGIPIIVDNLDIRGKDQLKQMADDFVAQAEQKAAQQGQKPDPMQVELQLQMQKLQLEQKKASDEMVIKQQELALKDKEIEVKALDLYRSSLISAHDSEIQASKVQAENNRTQADVAIKFASEMAKSAREDSKHDLEVLKHVHNVNESNKQPQQSA